MSAEAQQATVAEFLSWMQGRAQTPPGVASNPIASAAVLSVEMLVAQFASERAAQSAREVPEYTPPSVIIEGGLASAPEDAESAARREAMSRHPSMARRKPHLHVI